MTDDQAEIAMRILAELYANQIGMENPKILIKKKEKKNEETYYSYQYCK